MSQNTGLMIVVLAIALYLFYLQSKGRLQASLSKLLGVDLGNSAIEGTVAGAANSMVPSLTDVQPLPPIPVIVQGGSAITGGLGNN